MKILYNPSFSYASNVHNKKAKHIHTVNNTNISNSISFGAKSYKERLLENVEKTFEEKIRPFMNESRKLHNQIGAIGFAASNSLEYYNDAFSDYKIKQNKLINDENTPQRAKTNAYIKRAKEYNDNIINLNRIIERADYPIYSDNQKLKDEITKAAKIFDESNEVKKLSELKNIYDEAYINTLNAINSCTLESYDKELSKKIKNIAATRSLAVAYMFIIPYQNSVNLEKSINETKALINYPKQTWYEDEKKLEKLQEWETNIIESMDNYKDFKTKAQNFIDQNKDYQNNYPTKNEIFEAYKNMFEKNKEDYKLYFSNLDKYYDNFTKEHGEIADLKKLDKELELQKAVLKKINYLMYQIKTEYIIKQNENINKGN